MGEMPNLILIRDGVPVAELRLGDDEIWIGRGSDADLDVPDEAISRRHMRVNLTPRGYVARDAGTTNGVYKDGERVAKVLLVDGDLLQLAGFILRYDAEGFVASGVGAELARTDPSTADDRAPTEFDPDGPSTHRFGSMELLALRTRALVAAAPRLEMDDGRSVPVGEDPVLVGWGEEADLRLEGGLLRPRVAAVVEPENGKLVLHKVAPIVPVRVNGELVRRKHPLGPGDIVAVGPHEIRVQGPAWARTQDQRVDG